MSSGARQHNNSKIDCAPIMCDINPEFQDNGHPDSVTELESIVLRGVTNAFQKILRTERGEQEELSTEATTTTENQSISKKDVISEIRVENTSVVDVLPTLKPSELAEYLGILREQLQISLAGKQKVQQQLKISQRGSERPWQKKLGDGRSGHQQLAQEPDEGRLVRAPIGKNHDSSQPNPPVLLGSAELPRWQPLAVTKLVIRQNFRLAQLPVSSILELRNLRELDLGYNKLDSFPKSLCAKFTMQEETRLMEIAKTSLKKEEEELEEVLSQVEASGNPFPELVSLNLENNCLKVIPKEIARLRQLRNLNLENNMLLGLPNEIRYLPVLKTLNVGNNAFVDDQEEEEEEEEKIEEERGDDHPSDEFLDLVLPYKFSRPTELLEDLVTNRDYSMEDRLLALLDPHFDGNLRISTTGQDGQDATAVSPPRHALPPLSSLSKQLPVLHGGDGEEGQRSENEEYPWMKNHCEGEREETLRGKPLGAGWQRKGVESVALSAVGKSPFLASGRRGPFTVRHKALLLTSHFTSVMPEDEQRASSSSPRLGPVFRRWAQLDVSPCCSLCGKRFRKEVDFHHHSQRLPNPFGLVSFGDFLGNKSLPLLFFVCAWKPTSNGKDEMDDNCSSALVKEAMESTPTNFSTLNYDVFQPQQPT